MTEERFEWIVESFETVESAVEATEEFFGCLARYVLSCLRAQNGSTRVSTDSNSPERTFFRAAFRRSSRSFAAASLAAVWCDSAPFIGTKRRRTRNQERD